MKEYTVNWAVTVEAASPTEAARLARAIQVCPEARATVFDVVSTDVPGILTTIDLREGK